MLRQIVGLRRVDEDGSTMCMCFLYDGGDGVDRAEEVGDMGAGY